MGLLRPEAIRPNQEIIDPSKELPPIPEKSVAGWKEVALDEGDARFGEKLLPVGAFTAFDSCDTSAVYFGERGKKPEEINFLGQPVDREVSLIAHFVREGVLERLQKAQALLPEGYFFAFYDNFRPLDVQQALYDAQLEKTLHDRSLWGESEIAEYKKHLADLKVAKPDLDARQLEDEAISLMVQKFVSIPAPNKKTGTKHPSPHSTGAVVDLTIIKMDREGQAALRELELKKKGSGLEYSVEADEQEELHVVFDWVESQDWPEAQKEVVRKNWLSQYRYARDKARIFKQNAKPLDMGTDFDEFTDAAGTTYYENEAKKRELNPKEQEILQNRRFLYQVMTKAGFENYQDEWWHYSYGDNMWAVLSGSDKSFYGGFAELPDYCKDFEVQRRAVYEQEINDYAENKKELFTGEKPYDPTEA